MFKKIAAVIWVTLSCLGSPAMAEAPAIQSDNTSFDEAGALHIDGLWVPPSSYMSPEANTAYGTMLRNPDPVFGADLPAARAFYDQVNRARLEKARARYPVTITHSEIAGVPVDVVAPANGVKKAARNRVLINLHGGAFLWGAGAGGQLEAVPIASLLGVEVITVDYRQGPEHTFPAASEDVAKVYRELLKTHTAAHVGIYGCSAGGLLAAQSTAWFQQHNLPKPAAIGIFCAGGGEFVGDSSFLGVVLSGKPAIAPGGAGLLAAKLPYFSGVDPHDAMAFPADSPAVMRGFPPTLIISGTRDFAMSAAINQHRKLTSAGVDAELQLWDGMWHAFFMDSDLPESREAYAVIADFFGRHLR